MSDDFMTTFSGQANNEDLLAAIVHRVTELLETDIELLMSYLYRLDILESDIDFVLNKQMEVPVNQGLARLIFDKQMERKKYRERYKQEKIEGWDDW